MIPWKLLAKYLFDQPNKKEQEKIEHWIQKNPSNKQLLKDLTPLNKMKKEDTHINVDQAWNNLRDRIVQEEEQPAKKSISITHRTMLQYAAILLILFGIGSIAIFSYQKFIASPELISAKNVHPVDNKRITFPDGSIAYLNHKSFVNYPSKFSGKHRVINVDGEAFFDVKHKPSQPFIVKTEKAKIEVLGTSFNVKVNKNNNVEVFVKNGKVKLSSIKQKDKHIILTPGIIGVIKDDKVIKRKNTNANYLSWITKKMYFKNTNLQEVIQTLEQTYKVNIKISEAIPAEQLSLTATFSEESIDHILKVISQTFDIEVNQHDHHYVLTR